MIISNSLNKIDWLRHGFFAKQGIVSAGVYQSLNCSFNFGHPTEVKKNRRFVCDVLECRQLITLKQVHGNKVVRIDNQDDVSDCEADGLVTDKANIAIGILTADCAPVLFADRKKPVIGIAHSGWRGALQGITTTIIDSLCAMGSRKQDIVAVIGPSIQQQSYEVRWDFVKTFKAQSSMPCAHCFSCQNNRYYFDLSRYIFEKIVADGVSHIETIGVDTCTDDDSFFSYRKSVQQGKEDSGRQISAIGLIA